MGPKKTYFTLIELLMFDKIRYFMNSGSFSFLRRDDFGGCFHPLENEQKIACREIVSNL